MKKLLAVLLVVLGLHLHAQVSPCDSISVTGSQFQMSFVLNNVNTPANWQTSTTDSIILNQDSMSMNHTTYNYNPITGLPYDTLITCIVWGNPLDFCSITWVWNGTSWARMMMQQPYFCCDSITYWTDQSQGLTVGLDTSGIVHDADSMEVIWSVCNTSTCYSGSGMYAYFPQIMTTDTIKVCYDVWIYEANSMEVCNRCDSLVFDQNTYAWVLFSMSNPTGVNELEFTWEDDGIIYDLMGRKLVEVNVGQMYIRNNKKFIRVK